MVVEVRTVPDGHGRTQTSSSAFLTKGLRNVLFDYMSGQLFIVGDSYYYVWAVLTDFCDGDIQEFCYTVKSFELFEGLFRGIFYDI